jgi:putative sigma-54 modulation protein
MKMRIGGRHITVGDALRLHCESRFEDLKKYFSHIIDVDVTLINDAHTHKAEVTVGASGIVTRAVGEGADFYIAVDDAKDKLERQLMRYKGRLQKHRRRRQEASARLDEISAMMASHHVVEESSLDEAPEDIFAEFMPKIVHKDVRQIQALSVDEAVMQMDLLQTNFFIFQNPQTNDINVVYRDGDGSVGWVEPKRG